MVHSKKKDKIDAAQLDKLKLGFTAPLIAKAFKLDKLNSLYERHKEKVGIEFIDAVFNDLNIKYSISEQDLKNIPKNNAFIIIANHPYGFLDKLLMTKILIEQRPDFQVVGNKSLKKILPIADYVYPAHSFDIHNNNKISKAEINVLSEHIKNGSPIGVFPAGEVSTYQEDTKSITDKRWEISIIKLIKKAKVPIIPMYIHGSNSFAFHLLSKVQPFLRTSQIPAELLNKKNQNIQIRIGSPIPVKEVESFNDINKLYRYIRARVETMGSSIKKVKRFYKPIFKRRNIPKEVIEPVKLSLIEEEIEKLNFENRIHKKRKYVVYAAKSTQIPNILQEIGRLREITFREVGEGTNRKIDLDEYDLYYYHLFAWDTVEKKIIGAYRLGIGKDIIRKYGKGGFYINSLFKLSDEMNPLLSQSVEMGRSFITKDYQQKPLPLFLLWQGILGFMLKNSDHKYLIGPVSISNNYSVLSKSFLIAFIKQYHFDNELAAYVKPLKEFEPNYNKIDYEIIMEQFTSDVNKLDRLIEEIEPLRYRVPILLKKYIKQNAKIIGFNIDPKFNNALDGLMYLNIDFIPEDTLNNLMKELKVED
jgi:putative hemolysin